MASSSSSSSHGLQTELEAFQTHVTNRFQELSTVDDHDLLSIQWLQSLLGAFLVCHDEFKAILSNNKGLLKQPPMNKYVSDYLESNDKALDICNAVREGIDQIRQWQTSLEIVLGSFDSQRSVEEWRFNRAKKALVDLSTGMLDEKTSSSNSFLGLRNLSLGRKRGESSSSQHRPLSWTVPRTWSASKKLQEISENIISLRNRETISTNGLNVAVFTMSYVLLFVMWALVAAIPCQDRGLEARFTSGSKQFLWAGPILLIREKILDKSKKRDRRNVRGLLREIHEIETFGRKMQEMVGSVKFPLANEKEIEMKQSVEEIGLVHAGVKAGLDPLAGRVREVFKRIAGSRTEGLALLRG